MILKAKIVTKKENVLPEILVLSNPTFPLHIFRYLSKITNILHTIELGVLYILYTRQCIHILTHCTRQKRYKSCKKRHIRNS